MNKTKEELNGTRVSILGSVYTFIVLDNDEELEKENAFGLCNSYMKTISISSHLFEEENKCTINQIIRHELIHAFLFESGLDANTFIEGGWADNEEMVDWMAIQYPKIKRVFSTLEIED